VSTGHTHPIEKNEISFESIDAQVSRFDLSSVTTRGAGQAQPPLSQRLLTAFAVVRPILIAVAAIPLIPAKWRVAIRAFITTLDEVTATFKAGKDLAVDDGGTTVEMEPKLPAGLR